MENRRDKGLCRLCQEKPGLCTPREAAGWPHSLIACPPLHTPTCTSAIPLSPHDNAG